MSNPYLSKTLQDLQKLLEESNIADSLQKHIMFLVCLAVGEYRGGDSYKIESLQIENERLKKKNRDLQENYDKLYYSQFDYMLDSVKASKALERSGVTVDEIKEECQRISESRLEERYPGLECGTE